MSKSLPFVNCLNCRHCSLLPHSDFSREIVPIHCGKTGRNVPAKLEKCLMADKRMRRARKLSQCSRKGDRSGRLTAAFWAYLRAHYPTAPMEALMSVLQRDARTIRKRASDAGIERANRIPRQQAAMRNAVASRRNLWPVAQGDAARRLQSSDAWPSNGDRGEVNESKWRAVEAEINALGPHRTRRAIRCFIDRTQPGYQKKVRNAAE